jgi:AcrR family transcriptional regulator
MPKIVDRDARRDEILDAVYRVIARQGMVNATTREIAKEAGLSNGVLTHYFADKEDIMVSALRRSHGGFSRRMVKAIHGQAGLLALRTVMLEALPLDEQRLLEARVEVTFWGQALGSAPLVQIQNDEFERFWDLLLGIVSAAAERGELQPGADLEELIHEMVVLMDGLSLQAVMHPARATPRRQLAMLDAVLDRWASAKGRRNLRASRGHPGT